MEEQDIKNIDFANRALDFYLRDEKSFIQRLGQSMPYLYCINMAYTTLHSFGELPNWWRKETKEMDFVKDAVKRAIDWYFTAPDYKIDMLTRAILVLEKLAEKRIVE